MPFHIWLPDAMEGPTPVSALIHAATMVVAGVYLVARLFPMYYFVDEGAALHVVAYVGAFSSLFAAVIALTQNDIKRILAFSTMSQIGYLMMALGVSGYGGIEGLGFTASMFHLFTHAMFKALLFLCAGSVIHAVHTNNLLEMGGLRKYLPVTNITFLIAALAISGVPPFSGFFSKDEMLAAAFESNSFLFWMEWIVAGLTAFYMFRLYFGIFWGKKQVYSHAPHESPLSMTLPLMFLAIMSAIAGFIPFSNFISPDYIPYSTHLHWNIAAMSVGIGLVGIIMAWLFYKKETSLPATAASLLGVLYKWASNKFYFDELYLFITRKIIFKRIAQPFSWFDRNVVDGTINLIGDSTVGISTKMKGIQSGKLQDYAFMFISGMVVMIMVVIYFIS
jgi:NADH-quinone oxidoreductase subunit L